MRIYSANGNIIGIYLNESGELNLPNKNKIISQARENNVDTVMIIDEIRAAESFISTRIFEPNSGADGGWSTMCGNGVRAVASYFQENVAHVDVVKIVTLSGILDVRQTQHGYRVGMGALCDRGEKYISQQVDSWEFIEGLFAMQDISLESVNFGFTSTDIQDPDGEPHLCLRLSDGLGLVELKEVALIFGQTITNNFLAFPNGINANFYSLADGKINLVTHERNLGLVAEKSITKSCGTGSTVVAALHISEALAQSVVVASMGGDLIIEAEGDKLFMTGGATRIK